MSTKPKTIEGVTTRHARTCTHRAGRCSCKPTYQAHVLVRGRRLRKTFPTPAAARAWRQDQRSAARRGEHVAPQGRRTVADAIADFTRALESGSALKRGNRPYKPSVARAYTVDLRGRVLERLGDLRLADLERGDLQAFVEWLSGEEELSASRVRGVVVATQAMLRRELRAQRMVANPAADLDLPALPTPDEKVLVPAETEALIEAAPEAQRLVWALAGWAGLRRGEIRALRVDDVDLAANVLHVRRSWDDVAGPVAPKSRRGTRDVPLAPALRALILEHLARSGRRGGDLICGREAGEAFTPTFVDEQAREAWKAENVKRLERREQPLPIVGLHRFRHAWISAMLASGAPLASVALWAGHDVKVMTSVYMHAIPGRGHEDGDLIGEVFGARHLRDNPRPRLAVVSGSERQ